jgi:hypothetical protein
MNGLSSALDQQLAAFGAAIDRPSWPVPLAQVVDYNG